MSEDTLQLLTENNGLNEIDVVENQEITDAFLPEGMSEEYENGKGED